MPRATTVEFSRGRNPLLNDLTEEGCELLDGHVPAPGGRSPAASGGEVPIP